MFIILIYVYFTIVSGLNIVNIDQAEISFTKILVKDLKEKKKNFFF